MIETSSAGPLSPSVYWLLSKRGKAHEIFLLVDGGEPGLGKALPVFTAERLAVAFLESSALYDGVWRARRLDGGELISVLYGPCGRVGRISLDPVGDPVVSDTGLRADVGRGVFLDMLSGRSRRAGEGGPRIAPGLRTGALVGA